MAEMKARSAKKEVKHKMQSEIPKTAPPVKQFKKFKYRD